MNKFEQEAFDKLTYTEGWTRQDYYQAGWKAGVQFASPNERAGIFMWNGDRCMKRLLHPELFQQGHSEILLLKEAERCIHYLLEEQT